MRLDDRIQKNSKVLYKRQLVGRVLEVNEDRSGCRIILAPEDDEDWETRDAIDARWGEVKLLEHHI
ncbi:MAG: hypothetical protein JRH20_02540 [Deltaproteobacteria bacterium]|nr:hypothetical protein [Deltaproteobacteria bacterium]